MRVAIATGNNANVGNVLSNSLDFNDLNSVESLNDFRNKMPVLKIQWWSAVVPLIVYTTRVTTGSVHRQWIPHTRVIDGSNPERTRLLLSIDDDNDVFRDNTVHDQNVQKIIENFGKSVKYFGEHRINIRNRWQKHRRHSLGLLGKSEFYYLSRLELHGTCLFL